MQKGWSVFFGIVLFGTFIIWFIAPFYGWWLPENVSSFGGAVDDLYYVITGFTAFFFVLTELVLVYAMWRFAARDGEKSVYTHGNHRLEVLWTAVPATILLFIAFAQISAWTTIKYRSRMPSPDLTVTVTARQWEWRMRYPLDSSRFHYDPKDAEDKTTKERMARAWAEIPEPDDIHVPNELHAWKNADVKVWLRTLDVLHSFTLPNLRLKQDTLPGKTIPMWFRVTKSNARFGLFRQGREVDVTLDENGKITQPADLTEYEGRIIETGDKRDAWEVACQELCGGRHFAMRGRLYVHDNKKSYLTWLDYTRTRQQARSVAAATAVSAVAQDN